MKIRIFFIITLLFTSLGYANQSYACHAINGDSGGVQTSNGVIVEDLTDPCLPLITVEGVCTSSADSGNSFPCPYTGIITATNVANGQVLATTTGDLTVVQHGQQYCTSLVTPICPGNTTQIVVDVIRDSNGAVVSNLTQNIVSSVPAFNPTFNIAETQICAGAGCATSLLALDYRCGATWSSTGGTLTDNGDGTADFVGSTPGTYDITYTLSPGNACEVSETQSITVINCECIMNVCMNEVMSGYDIFTGASTDAAVTNTYVITDAAGNILGEDAAAGFNTGTAAGPVGGGLQCGQYNMYQVSYESSEPVPSGNVNDLEASGCYDVSCCPCIVNVYEPVLVPPTDAVVCDGVDICQDFTVESDPPTACSDGTAVDLNAPLLPVNSVGQTAFSYTATNTDPGNAASGGPTNDAALDMTFTGVGGTAGGPGTSSCITVTPIHTPDFDIHVVNAANQGGNVVAAGTACEGPTEDFAVYVASAITASFTPACPQNEFDVTVAGGFPDFAGTNCTGGAIDFPTDAYSFLIDGLAATPASGTVTDGGVFNFTGQTAGVHTVTIVDDNASVANNCAAPNCQIDIDVEAYDPFMMDFQYTCDPNTIIITSITGGQDPALNWLPTSNAEYTVTVGGTSLTATAPTFPLTFTDPQLAEGTYDITVEDAIGCSATFQAEAYDPIVLTDNSDRCDPYHQLNVTIDGGQPDHPGTTDIQTGTNGAPNGSTTYDFNLYSVTSDIDGLVGNTDSNGNITSTTNDAGADLSCGTHELTFSYDLLDDDGSDTGTDCTETIRVDVYEDIQIVSSTPACGEIDIEDVVGGWDPNCANGWDNAPVGYTITITGPNNSALIGASSYTVGPLAAFAGTEFAPGVAGVPVNGLPGGQYNIAIDDGRNGACIDEFSIDIVGCCPASSDADTDYQLCGMNQPSAQPGPNEDLPSVTPIFGDLPNLSINSPATNLNIDMDTDLTLNTDDTGSGADAGGDGVDWFLGPDPFNDDPYTNAAMISIDECSPGIYTLYAFLRCDGNHDGNFNPGQEGTNPGSEVGFDPDDGNAAGVGIDSYIPAGQVTITVWPEIAVPDIWYPNFPVKCQVNLLNPCPDVYVLEVTDEDGNNYIADNTGPMFIDIYDGIYTYDGLATPNPGTIGDLTLNITNQDAIAAFDGGNSDGDNVTCREVEFEREYICCLAESGLIEVDFGCAPYIDPETGQQIGTGDDLTFPVLQDFMGDVGTLQLPNYYTYVVVVETWTGNIVDVIQVGFTDDNGVFTDNRPISIPYADFQNYPSGVGTDDCDPVDDGHYDFYTYNYFTANPPADANLPNGISDPTPPTQANPNGGFTNGMATHIDDVTVVISPQEGCYDISYPATLYIPNPMTQDGNVQTDEGDTGSTSPFYFSKREMFISGGTPPYSYDWNAVGNVRNSILYTACDSVGIRVEYDDNAWWEVFIYDDNDCTAPIWHFTNDTGVGNDGENPIIDVKTAIIEDDMCVTRGAYEGSIDIVVEGGSGWPNTDYQYEWTGPFTWDGTGQGTASISNCPFGWYAVTVTEMRTGGMGDNVEMGDQTEDWFWVACERPGGRGKADLTTNSLEAFPNPFADATTIEFGTVEAGSAKLSIYSLDGKELINLFDGETDAKTVYTVPFQTDYMANGIYLLRLETSNGVVTNYKLVVAK